MTHAAGDLAYCLPSRGPSPKNLVSYTAEPARVSLTGGLAEKLDVITQLPQEKISSTLTSPVTTTSGEELVSFYGYQIIDLTVAGHLIKCYVNHKNIRAKRFRELFFLRKQD